MQCLVSCFMFIGLNDLDMTCSCGKKKTYCRYHGLEYKQYILVDRY